MHFYREATMTQEQLEARKSSLGRLPYVICLCAFILLVIVEPRLTKAPPIGAGLVGVVAVVWGILKRAQGGWGLITLGLGQILCTFLIWGICYLVGQAITAGDKHPYTVMKVRELVKRIEGYKSTRGRYPESLNEVEAVTVPQEGSPASAPLPSPAASPAPSLAVSPLLSGVCYQLTPDRQHYYLFWVGRDGKPFTADDENPLFFSNAELKDMGLKMRGLF